MKNLIIGGCVGFVVAWFLPQIGQVIAWAWRKAPWSGG